MLPSENRAVFRYFASRGGEESVTGLRRSVDEARFLRKMVLRAGFDICGVFEADGWRDIGKIMPSVWWPLE